MSVRTWEHGEDYGKIPVIADPLFRFYSAESEAWRERRICYPLWLYKMHVRGRYNGFALHQDCVTVEFACVGESEEREDEAFAYFCRGSLPELLLERLIAVVIWLRIRQQYWERKSRRHTSKKKVWKHKDVTFGAYPRTPRTSRSTISSFLATKGRRAENRIQEDSEACERL